MVSAKKTSRCMDNFFIKKDTKEEISIVNAEVALIYHNVKHGLSYNSLDCWGKNIHKIIPDSQIAAKMTCGRTKASAITRSVLGPYSQEKLISDLKESYYFSVGSDASNVGNIKTFPYFPFNILIVKKVYTKNYWTTKTLTKHRLIYINAL